MISTPKKLPRHFARILTAVLGIFFLSIGTWLHGQPGVANLDSAYQSLGLLLMLFALIGSRKLVGKLAFVTGVLAGVVSCDHSRDGFKNARIAELCEEKGKLKSTEPLVVSGYLRRSVKGDSYEFSDAANELLQKGFEFIELESVPSWYTFPAGVSKEEARIARTKAARITISPAGPGCTTFENEINRHPSRLVEYRKKGLPDGQCIAVEITSELRSLVERRELHENEWRLLSGTISKSQFAYIDRQTGMPLNELWAFGAPTGGGEYGHPIITGPSLRRCWTYDDRVRLDGLVRGTRANARTKGAGLII